MHRPLLIDRGVSDINFEDGTRAQVPTTILDKEEAELLFRYKQFLSKYGLREALYCAECDTQQRNDGIRASVSPREIGILCRHRLLFWRQTM